MEKKHKVFVVFGTRETIMDEGKSSICKYSFSTVQEKNAFLQGIAAAEGWMETSVFDSRKDATEYVKETKR
jgi:hypothetical protein